MRVTREQQAQLHALIARPSAQGGLNYSRIVSAALPNMGTRAFFYEDHRNNRSETVVNLALRLDRTVELGIGRVTLMADVFNLLNGNTVTNFFPTNGANFNEIITAMDPRTVKVGVKCDF